MSGTTPSIFSLIAQAESGSANVYGPNTSSGQAQGYYQITTGTWNDFAPAAGVSLAQYPTPYSAPENVQTAVASVIPFSRWANSTQNYVQQQLGPLDTSQTVGSLAGIPGGLSLSSPPDSSSQDGFGAVIDVAPGGYDPSAAAGQPGSELAPLGSTNQSGILGGNAAATAEASTPGYLPPSETGGPAATGITPGLAAGISSWIGNIESSVGGAFTKAVGAAFGGIEDWVTRGFLILIGVVILSIALWRIAAPDVSPSDMARLAATAAA